MLESYKIREQFINFFKNKEHKFHASAPVIPYDDPTLLFINAGMNQFKDIFLGIKEPKNLRAVNSQKCIRAGGKHNDLEEVGKDSYHHTFFEMLGNWSFGDYYKEEAIQWSWELLTEVWKLPKEKLYATVHTSDKEAFQLWKDLTDINPEHISYHDDKDNFWEMGEIGPCGPCSEIHFDLGEDGCDKKGEEHVCEVNGVCGRYIEIWNLVFMQYLRDDNKNLHPLQNKYIDTGAGLERVCRILQNVESNYDTDLFVPIIEKISEISSIKYEKDERGTSHRVIADHIRTLAFSIADGGIPSNEGRGYVLRRILRRAARHGHLLNLKKPFLYKLVDTVIEIMGDHFKEIKNKRDLIIKIIKSEEEKFISTLDNGLEKFKEFAKNSKNKIISGEDAFMLYDTFGFPLDLTEIIAEEKGFSVDIKGFNKQMEKQKERARNAAKFSANIENIDWEILDESIETGFVGYENYSGSAKILRYSLNDKEVKIVLDKTPFYVEKGGQKADIGKIYNDDFSINITDVQMINGLYVHLGKIENGKISNKKVNVAIDTTNRLNLCRNHTVTHVLHSALKKVLGDHVQQKGSLVDSEYLRFDFVHFNKMTTDEIQKVEDIANKIILESLPVKTTVKSLEKAKKEGATALFGEKYEGDVRVVTIGDFSKELCGGTHLNSTGQIGNIKIISENSSSAGVRRIEAISGFKALEYFRNNNDLIAELSQKLSTKKEQLSDKIDDILKKNKELSKEIKKMNQKAAGNQLDDIISKAKDFKDFKLIVGKVSIKNAGEMRNLGDQIKNKIDKGIGVLAADVGGKVSLVAVVSKNLIPQYKAGNIVGKVAKLVKGGGGGRPDMAMAGGKDVSKIDYALSKVEEIIENK